MEWQKLITSGSNTHLEALHLLGATSSVAEVSNSVYYPDDEYFRLHDFEFPNSIGANDYWKGNNANSNASGNPWISTDRTVDDVIHRGFDVSYLSPNGDPQNNTGPFMGINPSTEELSQNAIEQDTGAMYLYTETSDDGENTYSITSPLINLNNYLDTKLVFYFYLFGQNAGNFKVFTSTSQNNLEGANSSQRDISYAIESETTSGTFDLSDPISQVGYQGAQIVGQTHDDRYSEWYRAEVNLDQFQDGYIWIVYESGGPNGAILNQADFAISNVFLDFGSYIVPETEEIDNYELSLKVLGNAIKLYGLPEEDPHEEGQLYQDPGFINANQGFILISNGPL